MTGAVHCMYNGGYPGTRPIWQLPQCLREPLGGISARLGATMSDDLSFRARLKRLRQRRGLSQRALAEQVDVSEETVRSWEAGRRRPGPDTVVKLATVLGLT